MLESYIMDPSYRPALHPCILIQPNSPIAAMLQILRVPHQLDQATLSVILKSSLNDMATIYSMYDPTCLPRSLKWASIIGPGQRPSPPCGS